MVIKRIIKWKTAVDSWIQLLKCCYYIQLNKLQVRSLRMKAQLDATKFEFRFAFLHFPNMIQAILKIRDYCSA